MYVTQHNAKDFRNLENAVISPDRSINIIFGENGQGKTNLIESIWLFTGCHSFRTRKNSQLIRENCERSMLDISFFAFDRDQTARLELTDKKNVWINGVHKDTPRRLIGEFPAVLFSPATLSIVQDGPGERRKFIDIAISLVKPNYAGILSKYIKTLSERNALLRQAAASGNISSDMFFSWDAQLSALGAKILRYRFEYLDMIKKQAAENYSGITAGREKLTVRYDTFCKATDFDEQSAAQTMLDELEKSRETDIRRQFTGTGPHKDDFDALLDGIAVKAFGSQGQTRTAAISLKLSERELLRRDTGEEPVLLLDDVLSELDATRQDFVLNQITSGQVLITCCEPGRVTKIGKTIEIRAGGLVCT